MRVLELLFLAALGVPAIASANGLTIHSPLSAWHDADAGDKRQLIQAVADQLQASAGMTEKMAIPTDSVMRCVDDNHAPDRLTIRNRTVTVTTGMAIMVCLKIQVPQLRAAKYQEDE